MRAADLHCEVTHSVEPAAWDSLAASLAGSVFHTHAWAEAECSARGGRPVFARWADGADRTVAVATGAQRPAPDTALGRFVSVVRLDSPPAAGGRRADYLNAFLGWARASGVAEVRFGSFDGVGREWGETLPAVTERLEFVLGPDPRSQLESRMHKRTRRYANRAAALGVQVKRGD